VGRDKAAGLLAVGAALSVAAGSLLDVARTVFPGGDVFTAMRLWSQTSGDASGAQSRMLVSGLSLTLSAVLTLGLGAILLTGRGGHLGWLRGAAAAASGMVAATALDELLSAVDTGRLVEGARFSLGGGFWLFTAAMALAVAAVAVLMAGSRSTRPQTFSDGQGLSDAVMPNQASSVEHDSGHAAPHEESAYPL
jgi:hypothetical protein